MPIDPSGCLCMGEIGSSCWRRNDNSAPMNKHTRRSLLSSSLATAASIGFGTSAVSAESRPRNGRIKQSVCRWCYEKTPLPELCAFAAEIGLKGIDLLQPAEYDVPKRLGRRC